MTTILFHLRGMGCLGAFLFGMLAPIGILMLIVLLIMLPVLPIG